MCKGVANGFVGSPIIDGSRTTKPIVNAIVPTIIIGKIYEKSLGQELLLEKYMKNH
jgi:hypothetical protein